MSISNSRMSNRVQGISPSKTLAVMKRAKELMAQGIDVINLSVGEPDFPTPKPVLEATKTALDKGFTKYTPAAGAPYLKQAVADKYSSQRAMPVTAANVALGTGAKAVLFHVMQATLNPGDEVILPSPFWVSFPEMAALAGASTRAFKLSADDGFALHADELIASFSDATRMVILNSPNNPTGAVWKPESIYKVAKACAERGIWLVTDECYEYFVFGDTPFADFAPIYEQVKDVLCMVGSVSKTYSMTGYRVGWAVGPEDLIQAMSAMESHSAGNPTTFAQRGALAALTEDQEALIEPMRQTYSHRRDVLLKALDKVPGLSYVAPQGAFYAFLDCRELLAKLNIDSDITLCKKLLEEARVALVPGSAFGFEGGFRLSYAVAEERLLESVERILTWVNERSS